MRRIPFLALVLSGCWLSDQELAAKVSELSDADADTDVDVDTDTDVDVDNCEIVAVTPPYGSEVGGSDVEITVSGLVGDPKVWFAQKEAEVVAVDEDVIRVLAPSRVPGVVRVSVETDDQSCDLPTSYEFWPDGSGEYSSLGAVHWYTFQGGYWQDDTPYGEAWMALTEPTPNGYWYFWSPGSGAECRSEYSQSLGDFATLRSVGGTAVLSDGAGSDLSLPWVEASRIYTVGFSGPFVTDTTYDLLALEQPDFPSYDLVDAVETPRSISILAPPVSGTNLDSIFTTLNQSIDVEWSDPGSGDYVLVRAVRVVDDVAVEEVRCMTPDDGSVTVPGSAWTGWSFEVGAQYIIFEVGRVQASEVVFVHDHSMSGLVAIWWATGAVSTL